MIKDHLNLFRYLIFQEINNASSVENQHYGDHNEEANGSPDRTE